MSILEKNSRWLLFSILTDCDTERDNKSHITSSKHKIHMSSWYWVDSVQYLTKVNTFDNLITFPHSTRWYANFLPLKHFPLKISSLPWYKYDLNYFFNIDFRLNWGIWGNMVRCQKSRFSCLNFHILDIVELLTNIFSKNMLKSGTSRTTKLLHTVIDKDCKVDF